MTSHLRNIKFVYEVTQYGVHMECMAANFGRATYFAKYKVHMEFRIKMFHMELRSYRSTTSSGQRTFRREGKITTKHSFHEVHIRSSYITKFCNMKFIWNVWQQTSSGQRTFRREGEITTFLSRRGMRTNCSTFRIHGQKLLYLPILYFIYDTFHGRN